MILVKIGLSMCIYKKNGLNKCGVTAYRPIIVIVIIIIIIIVIVIVIS